jgi:hypothetical protein
MGNDSGEFNPADGGVAVPAVGPTEARREVVNGALRLQLTGFGRTDSDSGVLFQRNNLTFAESHRGLAMKGAVRVNQISARGCPGNPGNPAETEAAIRFEGIMFNTGAGNPGVDNLGDVTARVAIKKGSTFTQLQAVANMFECLDGPCNDASGISGPSLS